jgi:hypothetical protein
MPRLSAADRIQIASRAEAAIMQFARPDPETGLRPHALWHKHVHNVTLDPVQVLKMVEMDMHPNTIDVSCRRTGKTACKEVYLLEHLATMPHQDLGVVAPRQQQAQNNLSYHLEAIQRSQMLASYIGYKNGRKQQSDTKFAFANGSGASAYGIMSQIDGDSLTAASLEETDDMPSERLLSRFLPMLGAARRLGVDPGAASFKPQIRITGVFKGADVLQTLLDSGQYKLLPPVDVYLGIQLGILNEKFMLEMRAQLPEGEFIRQFLCMNVAAQNFIWEVKIRRALAIGLQAGLQLASPLPGAKYKKRGLLSFGYDHTGHGESLTASKSALVVAEQIGGFITFPFVKTWAAGTDDKVIENDLLALWQYFMPDTAFGDAFGVGMLTSLNDRLFANGLTDIDRRTIGDGQSTASTWGEWPFAPIRFEGMTKHSMASSLKSVFHNGNAAIPYIDTGVDALRDDANVVWTPKEIWGDKDASADWILFVRQLGNIKAEQTKAGYLSYKMAEPRLGDDLFDAAMAANWGLTTRGAELVPAVIGARTQTRAQLLGMAA